MTILFSILFILLLGYGIAALVTNYGQKQAGGHLRLPYGIASVGVASLFLIFAMTIKVIGAQEVAVLITPKGVSQNPIRTGWELIAPWNSLEYMDKTVWVYTFSDKNDEGQKKGPDAIWTSTKDGIKIGLDVSIAWGIDPDFAPWILQNVSEADGGNAARYLWIEENLIRAKAKSTIALTVSNFTPIEVYSNRREDIQKEAFGRLSEELKVYHLVLKQIDIREVFYNGEYEKAINEKKLAEQEVLRLLEVTKQKQELLKQSTIDKDIAIQKAEGESKSLQITGQSISNNPKIIQLEWVKKWDGQLPTYMMGNGQGVMLNMAQDKEEKGAKQ